MARREREILERAVHTIAEQAAKADEIVDEATEADGGTHPVTIHAKMLRLELLKVKADLERELETWVPQLHEVRPRRALGVWARRLTGALGAPGAGAARRASDLGSPTEEAHLRGARRAFLRSCRDLCSTPSLQRTNGLLAPHGEPNF